MDDLDQGWSNNSIIPCANQGNPTSSNKLNREGASAGLRLGNNYNSSNKHSLAMVTRIKLFQHKNYSNLTANL